MKKFLCLLISITILLSITLTGCGPKEEVSKADSQQTLQQSTKEEKNAEKVSLQFFHYQSEGQETFTQIVKKFEDANPNIKVEADLSGGDQYNTILKTKFAANESADIVGVHPGISQAVELAKAGYLEDLTSEVFTSSIDEGALRMASYNGKVFALPIDAAYIAAYYNKDIFAKLNINTPKTWKDFTDICEKLKQSKITPIAVGNKDLWVTQLIPYALAPTVIYSKNINFDKDMYDEKMKFNGPEWKKVMDMYMELNKKGYFNEGQLSTTYDQSLALFAQGKTAMTIMGTWAIKPIKDLNKDIKIGLFILPASDDGNNWASAAVGGMLAVSSESKYKAEAKKFLDFFMQKDNYDFYLVNTKNFPTVKGVTVNFDPAAEELTAQVKNSYNFLDQNWPAGVQDVMLKGFQEFFVGKSAEDVLTSMDKEWANRTKK